jgi:hypothetical protein
LAGSLDWIAALVEDNAIRHVHATPPARMAQWQMAPEGGSFAVNGGREFAVEG